MTDSANVVPLRPLALPDLDEIFAYRGVYALCTTSKDGQALKATHYASVLIGGAYPTWGVWTVGRKFLRFASSRAQIENAYPRLVWRRKMATWSAIDLDDKSIDRRRDELQQRFGRKLP